MRYFFLCLFAGVSFGIVISQASAAVAIPSRPVRPWTILLYMNGDNNLDRYVRNLLERVKRGTNAAASGQGAYVVVQFDGDKVGDSKRISFNRTQSGELHEEVLAENIEYDMGSAQTLADFVAWGTHQFPSEHVALAVVGHGRGILNIPNGDGSFAKSAQQSFISPYASSSDDTSHTYMSEEDLAQRLSNALRLDQGGKKLDLLIYNSCLMGNLEVLNAFSRVAEYAVMSEYTIAVDIDDTLARSQGVGVSVEELVNGATANRAAPLTAVEIGRKLIAQFEKDYRDMGLWNDVNGSVDYVKSTLSLFRLSAVTPFIQSLNAKIVNLRKADHIPLFLKLLAEPQVDSLGYTDLGVLLRQLGWDELVSRIYGQNDFIVDRAILHFEGQSLPAGLSVFFPSVIARDEQVNPFIGFYSQLSFAQWTGWGEQIVQFRKTVRERKIDTFAVLVKDIFVGKIARVRPSDDPEYNEKMIYMMMEQALDDGLNEGRPSDMNAAQKYWEMIRNSKYSGAEFLEHRARVKERLKI